MLALLTIGIMLGTAYAYWREGVLTAVAMLVNLVLAGVVAFCFYEPLADALEGALSGGPLRGYEDWLSLTLIFVPLLALLRLITNNLAPSEIEAPALLNQIGAVVAALVMGYLASGILLCILQTLPWGESFLGFSHEVDAREGAVRRVLPADRVWLALVHRAGKERCLGSAGEEDAEGVTFDKDGSFELRYARRRRELSK
jgi:hypothetical protein